MRYRRLKREHRVALGLRNFFTVMGALSTVYLILWAVCAVCGVAS